MSVALLDTNDSNLQLWQQGEALSSPGYALLEGSGYRFGQAARAAARLRPREVNTRFWWQLSTEPLQPALGPARHTADLVHAHLQDLHREGGEPGEVLLAVSGSAQRDQLALLLGIVGQCPFQAVGLVNRSVALASRYGVAGPGFHLEIQLHQAVLSELAVQDDRVELRRALPLPGCGMLQLQERLVEVIAAAFIRQTRFDPRRQAATEQQLYDALPAALARLADSTESNIEINGYRARVSAAELRPAGERLFRAVREGMGAADAGGQLLADPLAGLLPGLDQELPGIEVLSGDALYQAVSAHGDSLVERTEALNLVTSLPRQRGADADPAPPAATSPEPDPASHILLGSVARPLLAAGTPLPCGCELFLDRGLWWLRGSCAAEVRINGEPWRADRALTSGDTLALPGAGQAQLIEVDSG